MELKSHQNASLEKFNTNLWDLFKDMGEYERRQHINNIATCGYCDIYLKCGDHSKSCDDCPAMAPEGPCGPKISQLVTLFRNRERTKFHTLLSEIRQWIIDNP